MGIQKIFPVSKNICIYLVRSHGWRDAGEVDHVGVEHHLAVALHAGVLLELPDQHLQQ